MSVAMVRVPFARHCSPGGVLTRSWAVRVNLLIIFERNCKILKLIQHEHGNKPIRCITFEMYIKHTQTVANGEYTHREMLLFSIPLLVLLLLLLLLPPPPLVLLLL